MRAQALVGAPFVASPLVAWMWLLLAGAALHGQEGQEAFETYYRDYMSKCVNEEMPLGPFLTRCNQQPQRAADLAVDYVSHPSPRVRRTALMTMVEYDLDGKARYIVEALADEETHPSGVVARIHWTGENAPLLARARGILRDQARKGEVFAADDLGTIGTAEDIPALAEGLKPPLAPYDQDRARMLGYRNDEMRFRRAMAKLGDPEQLAFFEGLIRSNDPHVAWGALMNALYIARPELAQAVASRLDDRGGAPSADVGPSNNQLAVETLAATFPEAGNITWQAERFDFWKNWMAIHRPQPAGDRKPPDMPSTSVHLTPPTIDREKPPPAVRDSPQAGREARRSPERGASAAFAWVAVGATAVLLMALLLRKMLPRR